MVQLLLHLGREAETPSYLVVLPLWEGVVGEHLNFRTLLPSATLPWTNRPFEAKVVEINLCLWLLVCIQ